MSLSNAGPRQRISREGQGRQEERPPASSRTTATSFLQANFRFLVSDAADLRSHHADADLMLDWGDVLEVSAPPPLPTRFISLHA